MIRIVILCLLWINAAYASADEKRLSLAFEDAPVGQVLQALADYQQLNLVVAPGVEGRVTFRLLNVHWRQAVDLLAQMAQLSVETKNNVLLIYPRQRLQDEKAVREEKAQKQAMMTRKVVLHEADASAVHQSLLAQRDGLMTSRGTVSIDKRTNALLIRDTSAALKEVENWIRMLDVPLKQIELLAHIVTISEEHLRELGVNWGMMDRDVQITQALRNPHLGINLSVNNPSLTGGFTLARIDGRLLDLELSALERENQIEIIASPRLITSHQQPASIKQGTEIPYEVSNGSDGATTIEFKEAVLGMEVTPVVLVNGRVKLKLRLSQNMPGRNIHHGETEVLTIDKQEIETQVILEDGQTLALGGIFQRQRTNGRDKVPLLGDVPLLGTLFRHDIREQKRRELVMFITPRLIQPGQTDTAKPRG